MLSTLAAVSCMIHSQYKVIGLDGIVVDNTLTLSTTGTEATKRSTVAATCRIITKQSIIISVPLFAVLGANTMTRSKNNGSVLFGMFYKKS